jgi:hypothetical protein
MNEPTEVVLWERLPYSVENAAWILFRRIEGGKYQRVGESEMPAEAGIASIAWLRTSVTLDDLRDLILEDASQRVAYRSDNYSTRNSYGEGYLMLLTDPQEVARFTAVKGG